jgi:hypothetical protein
MGTTRQIARDEWKDYFERFTKQHLRGETPEAVTIEVVSPTLGDQVEAQTMHLEGLLYDPKSSALEVWMDEQLDHLAYYPTDIWVIEEEGGFLSAVEIVRADGEKEILYITRSGPPARIEEPVIPQA